MNETTANSAVQRRDYNTKISKIQHVLKTLIKIDQTTHCNTQLPSTIQGIPPAAIPSAHKTLVIIIIIALLDQVHLRTLSFSPP